MIHTNRIVTVGEQESIIDRPIVLYRGDREVEIEFTLVGNEFTFSEDGNVIKSVNASHGQLVLNTPSGEHMFSELAECHEGKVIFVVTKEMIDEFIEMGFYSFQIRLYDSAEMKSRVTIPPVLNGFDIRNPIAAEDETNVVDQGIVDYARIFKDQSNEELPTFDWTGAYNKTEWVHHDVITENKMNKIEDALYSINANIKESDVVMLNTLDQVKKDADAYIKEHMAEVEADVEDFERELNVDVQQFKINTNAAMTAHKNEVSEELESVNSQLADIAYSIYNEEGTTTDKINKSIEKGNIILPVGEFKIDSSIIMKNGCKLTGAGIDRTILVVENTKTIDGVLLVDNINDCYISDLTIKSIDNKKSNGIKILNNSNNNKIDRVKIEGFGGGIIVEGQNYEVKNTTIRDCVCTNITMPTGGTYGISIANSDNTVIENCITTYNWLDGLKLRQKANNTKIIGGVSSYNGISAINDTSSNGNGIDFFRGGQNILIKDLICEHNKGVGIYIKNDKENIEDKYGPIKDIQIINCVSRFNDHAGLMINRVTGDTDSTAPLVNNILVSGGIYSNNNNSGIYVRGRNININNTLTENNQEYGIYIISSLDIICSNNQLLGNGLKSSGVYTGIRVDLSKRVNMDDNNIVGVSPSSSNGDYSKLTPITKTGAYIGVGCDDIYINNINVYNCSNVNFKVQVTMTEGTCIINHGDITSNVAFGSPGSTFIYNGKLYVKSSGTPNSWVVSEWKSIVG